MFFKKVFSFKVVLLREQKYTILEIFLPYRITCAQVAEICNKIYAHIHDLQTIHNDNNNNLFFKFLFSFLHKTLISKISIFYQQLQ